ncbi:MAG: hypothetical protein JNL97_07410 [Verrucomicrobiales bacterium]|nr:hypothetical protein [Verrucomicrobiales bacterium]
MDTNLWVTSCLCGGLLLCPVMPVLMSLRGPVNGAHRGGCLRIVWLGQGLLAVSGFVALASSVAAPYAAVVAWAGYLACIPVLLRRIRASAACGACGC